MHFLAPIMYTRYLGHSTLRTITLSVSGPYVLFLYHDALCLHTCISEYWRPDLPHLYLWSWRSTFRNCQKAGFLEKARKQVFQTSEGLAVSISTEPFRSSEGGFSDQITSDRVQTSLRYLQYREITPINSLPTWEICMLSKIL